MISALLLDERDNVLVAPRDISKGAQITEFSLTSIHDIPAGHKIARQAIPKGEKVLKYNTVIGLASQDIPRGGWVHAHNLELDPKAREHQFARDYAPTPLIPPDQRATFMGYDRGDGRVGTRNFIGIFITVNCSATVARKIAAHFDETRLQAYPNVDGVIPFVHQQGCGMEQTGEPIDLLRRTLKGYIQHPNICGALIVGLGCERNNLDRFFQETALETGTHLKSLHMQHLGGTRAAVEQGIAAVYEMLNIANTSERSPCSIEHLKIGLQCGGSDGFSAISANPALGNAMDRLVAQGGTAILSETPELYGIENSLTARCQSQEVGQSLLDRINWWLDYTEGRDVQMQGVVGPGNQQGGLANIFEKALGAAKKGGTTGIEAVYKYAEPVTSRGLVIMDTPGYDPVSATGQIAGGAQIICFTTGRGSCFGSYPAPTIKLASNTAMYGRMIGDMDLNCGTIIDGTATIGSVGAEILETIIRVASGAQSKSEEMGIGADEFAPWPIGVTG